MNHYVNLLKRDYTLRETVRTCQETIKLASVFEGGPDEFLDTVEQKLWGLSVEANSNKVLSMHESLDDALNGIEFAIENKGKLIGVPSGFNILDKETGGFQGGQMIILAARPSMGKTAIALNMLTNALAADKSVLLFSMEMSNKEITSRMLASLGRINSWNLRSGELSQEELDRLAHATNTLSKYQDKYGIDVSGCLSIFDVRTRARMFKKEKTLDLIIIDYIQTCRRLLAKNTKADQQ